MCASGILNGKSCEWGGSGCRLQQSAYLLALDRRACVSFSEVRDREEGGRVLDQSRWGKSLCFQSTTLAPGGGGEQTQASPRCKEVLSRPRARRGIRSEATKFRALSRRSPLSSCPPGGYWGGGAGNILLRKPRGRTTEAAGSVQSSVPPPKSQRGHRFVRATCAPAPRAEQHRRKTKGGGGKKLHGGSSRARRVQPGERDVPRPLRGSECTLPETVHRR